MRQDRALLNNRIIAHLDMDAFFAAVEERDKPRLTGRPIVVGSDPSEGKGRGVVSTANYKAREYGIRSGLPISKAWQFSEQARQAGKPEAVFLPVNFHRYQEVSDEIMKIIRQYAAVTEQASIDEMYLDLSNFRGLFEEAIRICREIKKEIWEKEKLTASIGLGSNKLIAKIASDMQKPDGLTVIEPDKVEEFLAPLSIRKIPGVGPKTEQYFNKLGIRQVRDLKKYAQEELRKILGKPRANFVLTQSVLRLKASTKLVRGKWSEALYDKIRGWDETPVTAEYEAKSIGEQETFFKDTLEFNIVFSRMEELCSDVFRRFERSEFKSFRTVVISVRFSDFETKSRSHTLPSHLIGLIKMESNKCEKNNLSHGAKKVKSREIRCGGVPKSANTLKVLKSEALKLLMPFFDNRENPKKKLIRLIGVRMEKLG